MTVPNRRHIRTLVRSTAAWLRWLLALLILRSFTPCGLYLTSVVYFVRYCSILSQFQANQLLKMKFKIQYKSRNKSKMVRRLLFVLYNWVICGACFNKRELNLFRKGIGFISLESTPFFLIKTQHYSLNCQYRGVASIRTIRDPTVVQIFPSCRAL